MTMAFFTNFQAYVFLVQIYHQKECASSPRLDNLLWKDWCKILCVTISHRLLAAMAVQIHSLSAPSPRNCGRMPGRSHSVPNRNAVGSVRRPQAFRRPFDSDRPAGIALQAQEKELKSVTGGETPDTPPKSKLPPHPNGIRYL